MKMCELIKRKLPLLLIVSILTLCTIFAIISCGDPELKTTDSKKGQCALDFNSADDNVIVYLSNGGWPSIAGKDLTVEAWIKPKATSATAGGIFGYYDAAGVIMWVKNNTPKFAIRKKAAPTSTDYTVDSSVIMSTDTWYHVAGVLVNEDHSTVAGHPTCGGAEGDTPHLDIYVTPEGSPLSIRACAATEPQGVANPDKNILTDSAADQGHLAFLPQPLTPLVDGNTPSDNAQFEGVIDEVRLWTVARTPTQLQICKDRELSTSGGGVCKVDSDILKGYWRMNECDHADILDWSGAGSRGTAEIQMHHWDGGWVTGAPIPMD